MNMNLEDLPPKMREQAERKLADLSRGKSPVDKLVDFDHFKFSQALSSRPTFVSACLL